MNRSPGCHRVQDTGWGGEWGGHRPPDECREHSGAGLGTVWSQSLSPSVSRSGECEAWTRSPPAFTQPELVPGSVSGDAHLAQLDKYTGNGYNVHPQNQHQMAACSASLTPDE